MYICPRGYKSRYEEVCGSGSRVPQIRVLVLGEVNLAFQLEPCVLYIGRAYRYSPDVAFYIFFSTDIGTEYFKHAAHSPFFSSKCRLFHSATFFFSFIIHILHTGCAKI
jgi:hypothetical protein